MLKRPPRRGLSRSGPPNQHASQIADIGATDFLTVSAYPARSRKGIRGEVFVVGWFLPWPLTSPLRRAGEQIIERPVTDSPESERRSGEELASVVEERRPGAAGERRSRTEDDPGDEETAVGGQVNILI
jgi:hypothetical protein